MTLWGAEFDANGLVRALYLTTSECTDDEIILAPRITRYERQENALLGEGHYKWSAEVWVTVPGRTLGYWFSMDHIYGLHFLSAAQ